MGTTSRDHAEFGPAPADPDASVRPAAGPDRQRPSWRSRRAITGLVGFAAAPVIRSYGAAQH